MIKTIIRAPKGRQEIEVDKIQIPDLWHTAMYLQDLKQYHAAEMVLECWHLAHDLITNIQAHNAGKEL